MDSSSRVGPAPKGNGKIFAAVIILLLIGGILTIRSQMSNAALRAVFVDSSIGAGAATGHQLGKADAPVQIVEFGDFECPHCGEFAATTEADIRAKLVNTGIVGFRYYDYPLPQFKNSWTAHLAASCAEDQGKFWEMHDKLYASQDKWNSLGSNLPIKVMAEFAKDLGLNADEFTTCIQTQKTAPRILGNRAEGVRRTPAGEKLGTPTFFIGARMFHAVPYDRFKQIVDSTIMEMKADSAKHAGTARR